MYIAPSSGHISLNFNMPFKLILRRFEVVFWCLEWECCTFWKTDGNSFKSTNTVTMALRIIYKLTLGYITLQTKMTLQYNMNPIFMIKWGPAAWSTLYFSWTTTHVSLYPTVDIPQSQDICLNEYKQWITNSFPSCSCKILKCWLPTVD